MFYLILLTQIAFSFSYKIPIEYHCSKYKNDEEIIHHFRFPIQHNPYQPTEKMTYAKFVNNHVHELKIINQKKCIPSIIFCLKYLSILEIIKTKFCQSEDELPIGIINLSSSLTKLHISNTKILRLPNKINEMIYLNEMKLFNTNLSILPDTIGYLPSLEFLLLSQNNLSSLPKTLLHLHTLRQLVISENSQLESIQTLNGHMNLTFLNVRNCSIKILPQNLPQLIYLNMANNHLEHLHGIETLGRNTNEEKNYNFYQNSINILTSSIALIPNLFQLNLAKNHLNILPEDIFNITTLKELNIAGNLFSEHHLNKYRLHFNRTYSNRTKVYI